jgi:hypothetical protein
MFLLLLRPRAATRSFLESGDDERGIGAGYAQTSELSHAMIW